MRVTVAFVIILLFVTPIFSQESSGTSNDLSELKARFQAILDEIDSDSGLTNGYESSVANLLSKVDNLQRTSDISQNISLDWFTKSGESTSVPTWMSTPLRIVLVVSSFEGMYLNSGIGTFYAALSDFLVHHGHSVTILYTRAENSSEKATFQRWKTSFEKRGVKVVRLEAPRVKVTVSLLTTKSYQVYRYLKDHQEDFDAVHFPEWEGPGYYSTLAKHEGLAFLSKILIVGLHGPWRWVKAGNFKAEKAMLASADDFETDWMERKSAEYADIVWTPSADLVQWLSSQGWSFPSYEKKSLYLMPFLPGREIAREVVKSKNTNEAPTGTTTVTELVFFGRLEKRKGLELFADALDKLTVHRPEFQDTKVTFLGRSTNIGSLSATNYLDQRATQGKWPFKVSFVTHKDRKGALEYLRSENGRVAVIPSLIENAPYTVYECLFLGIPFVATNLPSISALVHEDDRARVLTTADSIALSNKLENLLDDGVSSVRSSFNTEKVADAWTGFYEIVSSQLKQAKTTAASSEDDFQPLVSVCITHFNRPEFLAMAIESVNGQTYKNFEVVLVDDGSTSAAALAYVDSLKPTFDAKGWKIAKTRNQYLGAARNTAAKLARGEYLLFLDDDNLAKPDQLSTYVSVAGKTGADILTAAHDVFRGNSLPDESDQSTNIMSRSVPIGPSAPLGIFKNCFGDANFFIRKSSFMQIGGFTEDKGVGQEDHEFLAKAVLGGHQLLAIPEVLLYYRMHNKTDQMIYNTDPIKNHLRSKRPYEGVSEDNLDLLKILAYENHRSTRDARGLTAACNVSVHSLQPDRIPTLTTTSLTFIVSSLDCTVETIHIGAYLCTQPLKLSPTLVMCKSPSVAIPGDYVVSFTFEEDAENVLETGLSLEVYAVASPDFTTSAVMAMKLQTDPQTFNESILTTTLADIAGIHPNQITVASDVVESGNKKRDFTDIRDLRLVVTSTSKSDPASAIVERLLQILAANPSLLAKIGILLDSSQLASCDSTGHCECTANYQGVGCEQPAACPNNCSGNGQCLNGVFSRICQCDAGYTGKDCSSGTCNAACSTHGTCIITSGQNGTCSCDSGWTGADCMTEVLCPNNCTGNGNCMAGVCICNLGFTGTSCSLITATTSLQNDANSPSVKQGLSKDTIAFAVVVSVVGFVLVVVAAVGIYLYYKRHRTEQLYL